ncbi:MAG: GAF domain-containing protein [Opitutae bacterium]|nr:GAF domain-containing protein [Opitutae bacterium]
MLPAEDPAALSGSPPDSDLRTLALLYRINSLASKTEQPREALRQILAELVADFRAGSGSIALLNPDTSKLEIEVQHGLPLEENEDLALTLGQGITGWVAFYGRPLLIPDVTVDARYVCIRPAVRCEMAVPLLETMQVVEETSQVLGVINLDSDQLDAFTPADLRRLERAATETAAVMQRLWQLEQLRDKARQLEALITSGRSLVAQVEEHELLDTVVRDTRQVMQARACGLYLYDATRGTIRLAALADPEAVTPLRPNPHDEFPVDACAISAAIHTRKPIEFANVQSPDFRDMPDLPADSRLRSVLLTPLVFEREVYGALAVFTDHVHRFTNAEKRLCAALASLALVALQNARLYARVFQSEETLRRNERLTTLGLLAAEIAHEIRNPLTVIKLLFGSLGLEFPATDPRATDVRLIGEKLDQLEAIVTRVLSFGKAPASVHSRWPVHEVIEDTLVLIRLKLTQGKIQLHYTAPPRPLVIEAHKGQIQQVLLNLLLNATQAMPDGGTIAIAVTTLDRDGGSFAIIDVTDTGAGIPEAIRDKIFDSFLSSRPDGTGLGLAIAKRILRSHHGDIELVRTSTAGTTLRMLLPLAKHL